MFYFVVSLGRCQCLFLKTCLLRSPFVAVIQGSHVPACYFTTISYLTAETATSLSKKRRTWQLLGCLILLLVTCIQCSPCVMACQNRPLHPSSNLPTTAPSSQPTEIWPFSGRSLHLLHVLSRATPTTQMQNITKSPGLRLMTPLWLGSKRLRATTVVDLLSRGREKPGSDGVSDGENMFLQ